MSTLTAIRAALRTTLKDAITGVTFYARVVESPVVPCLIPIVATGEYIAFAGSHHEWPFDLHILVPPADLDSAQPRLDELVDPFGAKSIRRILLNNPTLGLSDVNARTEGISSYGFTFEAVGVDHLGATIRLVVMCSGTT